MGGDVAEKRRAREIRAEIMRTGNGAICGKCRKSDRVWGVSEKPSIGSGTRPYTIRAEGGFQNAHESVRELGQPERRVRGRQDVRRVGRR